MDINLSSLVNSLQIGSGQSVSGNAITFTGIPAGVKQVILSMEEISTNGTSYKQIQLGTSGGIVSSGYRGSMIEFAGSGLGSTIITTGLGIRSNSASDNLQGSAIFTSTGGNTWIGTFVGALSSSADATLSATSVSLSGSLTQIRLTTVNGTDTFDSGFLNIIYQ